MACPAPFFGPIRHPAFQADFLVRDDLLLEPLGTKQMQKSPLVLDHGAVVLDGSGSACGLLGSPWVEMPGY